MNKLKYLLLALVLSISTFTHLYRIDKTFIFHNDEARDVLIVKKMIDTGRPILLGPQTSVGNMYLGPLYYYLMLPALLLAKMNPVGPAIMAAIFAMGTTALLYIIGTKKYGIVGGLVAALFYSLSPVMLHYSRSSWNPNIVPFFATILILSLDIRNKWGWLILGLCAGIIFQLHYVALIMVGLVGLLKLKDKPKLLDLMVGILGFMISSMPFWLFEFRHNFVNSQAFLTFLREGSQNSVLNSSYLSRFTSNLSLTVKGVVGSSSIAIVQMSTIILIIAGIFLFVFLPIFTKEYILWYFLIGSVLTVSFLKEHLNVHYISFLFPVVSLAIASLSTKGPKLIRLFSWIFIIFSVWWSIPSIIYNLQTIDSIQVKRSVATANYIVSEAAGRKYNIVSTPGTYSTTIEYFLSLSNNPPTTNYEELIFDICEGSPCPLSDETTVLFYATGPTHPSISEYLGHPAVNEFKTIRTIIKNEPVSYGTWVATMTIDH